MSKLELDNRRPANAGEPCLLIEDRGAVRILTLNRPGKLNALNSELTQMLCQSIARADDDPTVKALVLAGNGRAFCAGADIGEFKELTPANQAMVLERAELSCRNLMQLQSNRKPIVSAVQGNALGGGAGLAIGCDIMVVATNVRLGYPELKHAIVPALVMTSLQRHFGRKLAFEMVATGLLLDANELIATGMTRHVVEQEVVVDTAFTIAAKMAEIDNQAMAATKSLFYRVGDLSFEAAMAAGRDVNMIMRGFREKIP